VFASNVVFLGFSGVISTDTCVLWNGQIREGETAAVSLFGRGRQRQGEAAVKEALRVAQNAPARRSAGPLLRSATLCRHFHWYRAPLGIDAFDLAFLTLQGYSFSMTFLPHRAPYVHLFLKNKSLCHHEHLFHDRNDRSVTLPPNGLRSFNLALDNHSSNVNVFLQKRDIDRLIMFVNPSVHANAAGCNSSRTNVEFFGKYRNNGLIGSRSSSSRPPIKVGWSEGYLEHAG